MARHRYQESVTSRASARQRVPAELAGARQNLFPCHILPADAQGLLQELLQKLASCEPVVADSRIAPRGDWFAPRRLRLSRQMSSYRAAAGI